MIGSIANRTLQLTPEVGTIDLVAGFGEDGAGELLMVDVDGEVFRVIPEATPGALALAALTATASLARLRRVRQGAPRQAISCWAASPARPSPQDFPARSGGMTTCASASTMRQVAR